MRGPGDIERSLSTYLNMLASGTWALITTAMPRGFLALDLAATGVQVADHVTDIIFRGHDFDLHHRLEELGTGLLGCFTEAGAGGDFEGENRGVDVMEGAVDERRLDAEHREASQRAGRQNAFDALLDARDVFLRNGAADDLGLRT